MNTMLTKIANLLTRARMALKRSIGAAMARWPTQLPQTPDAHYHWINSILDIGGFERNDSNVERISTAVLHIPNKTPTDRVPKSYFIKSLRKDIANQICYSVVIGFKQQREAAAKEASNASGPQVQETAG